MKLLKKASILLVFCLAVSTLAFASDVNVTFNGEQMRFDVPPMIMNERTMVPMRAVFETLDASVTYTSTGEGVFVSARKGPNSILFEIEKDVMWLNGEEVKLDAPPVIIDGRTLIPLRAVSESLGCFVDWDDTARTAIIIRKDGQYKIKSGRIDEEIYSEDGTLLISVSCVYPIIYDYADNLTLFENDSFVESLNNDYKLKAEELFNSAKNDYVSDAQELYRNMGDTFSPLEVSLTYDVSINRNDLLSVTTYQYSYLGGPHPNTERESRTFQMVLCKEFSLSDILGKEQDETDEIVKEKFENLLSSYGEFTDETKKEIDEKKRDANFYLTNDSLNIYYNPYEIAPYAVGSPEVVIDYADGSDIALDLSNYEQDEIVFSHDGNPTTGFTWEIFDCDEDILNVDINYVLDFSDETPQPVGKGGRFDFMVTGKTAGRGTLTIAYLRPWESVQPLEKFQYVFEVSENNKITLLSVRNLSGAILE